MPAPLAVTPDDIALLAPSARSSYRAAFAAGQPVLEHFGIAATPRRLAHFMAQVLHESAALTLQFENLNYSAARLPKVWPRRFLPRGPLDPRDHAHDPRRLANAVYGDRMGNTAPDDGFTFRGRGLLQLTGRDGYARVTAALRARFADAPDLRADPDAAVRADWCLHVAAAAWDAGNCNTPADADSLRGVTRAINGGVIGLAARGEWLARARERWPEDNP